MESDADIDVRNDDDKTPCDWSHKYGMEFHRKASFELKKMSSTFLVLFQLAFYAFLRSCIDVAYIGVYSIKLNSTKCIGVAKHQTRQLHFDF